MTSTEKYTIGRVYYCDDVPDDVQPGWVIEYLRANGEVCDDSEKIWHPALPTDEFDTRAEDRVWLIAHAYAECGGDLPGHLWICTSEGDEDYVVFADTPEEAAEDYVDGGDWNCDELGICAISVTVYAADDMGGDTYHVIVGSDYEKPVTCADDHGYPSYDDHVWEPVTDSPREHCLSDIEECPRCGALRGQEFIGIGWKYHYASSRQQMFGSC